MAWRALLCCLLAEVATAETASCSPSEDEETAQRTSFVQMAKHLEKHLESREAALPGGFATGDVRRREMPVLDGLGFL